MKKGFTLIELITVVIIIAIMAALALPQYTRFIERGQASTAKNALNMIRKGEAMYFTLESEYLACARTDGANCNLTKEVPELKRVFNHSTTDDWHYAVTANTNNFTATATRGKGVYENAIMTITDEGEWNITTEVWK